ncbi:MAG: TerC family protein [Pirellulaceae bacterium]|nr:TerC family protein [Planctomycetales bacterium]
MDWFAPLIALTAMEIVLGIDNIVFIAIVTARLPMHQRPLARRVGLVLALVMRIILLASIKFVMGLKANIITLTQLGCPDSWFDGLEHPDDVIGISWKDVILLVGGLFLIGKSVFEIHEKMEHHESEADVRPANGFFAVLLQIMTLDIIFSLDSVITAVGMADQLSIMIWAVIIAVAVMVIFANPVSEFVNRHMTLKILALSFLILIGVMLVAEGIGSHIDKRYIYFAMAFALMVEFINLRIRTVRSRASLELGEK